MGKLKAYINDNEYFLDFSEPQLDPQTVAEAQNWYVQFTGNQVGKTSLKEIVKMYEILNKSVDEIPF